MTFGPDGRLYVATFGSGVKRYDYNPNGSLTNGVTVWSRTASGNQLNGSLGIAFHQDPVLGTVMYLAPAISSTFNVTINVTQSILRLTDNDGDGNWGEPGEVRQNIVDNLRLTDLHQVNQLLVSGNTLYAGIGSRTRTGGNTSEYGGSANPDDGEFAYTGAINWIRDLTALSGNTTTANIAGFNITQPQTDTQPFTSTDVGKLTVYSTGFRNMYGMAFDSDGRLWATMNQNENPLKPDEIHQSNYQDDHGFPKKNEVSGDWKQNADALNAGFFQTSKTPVALLGDHASADGIEFTDRNQAFAGHPFVVRYQTGDDLLAIDPATGTFVQVATGFSDPLEVLSDPVGNLLVGTYGSGGRIYRLVLKNDAGDFDKNGVVDAADYVLWRKSAGQVGVGLAADGTGNGVVDVADYNLWRSRFGATVAGSAVGAVMVPEPAALSLLVCLTMVQLTINRRRFGFRHNSAKGVVAHRGARQITPIPERLGVPPLRHAVSWGTGDSASVTLCSN